MIIKVNKTEYFKGILINHNNVVKFKKMNFFGIVQLRLHLYVCSKTYLLLFLFLLRFSQQIEANAFVWNI